MGSVISSKPLRIGAQLVPIVLLIGVVAFGSGEADYLTTLRGITWPWLLAIFTVICTDRVLMAFKWSRLFALHQAVPPLYHSTAIYCLSSIYGLLLPVAMSADAVRVGLLTQAGYSALHATSSVIVERVIGLIVSMVFIGIAVAIAFDRFVELVSIDIKLLAMLTFACMLVAVAVYMGRHAIMRWYLVQKLVQTLTPLLGTLAAYRRGRIAEFTLLTVIEQLLAIWVYYLCAEAVGISCSFTEVFTAAGVSFAITRIPIFPSPLGVFELVFASMLAGFGYDFNAVVVACLLSRSLQLSVWFAWWFIGLRAATVKAL